MDLREQDIKDKIPNTCDWLLEHSRYVSWLEQRGLLWITGKPGSGKSTIMKFAMRNSKQDSSRSAPKDTIMSFFFSSRGNTNQRTAAGLYRALLYQLLRVDTEHAQSLISSSSRKKSIEDVERSWIHNKNELAFRVKSCILGFLVSHRLTLYIDALDECDEALDVFHFFCDLIQEAKTKSNPVGICVSCGSSSNLVPDTDINIRVDQNNTKDIQTYLHARFNPTNIRQQGKQMLEDDIASRASGVFQWVDLVVPQILKMYNDGKSVKSMLVEVERTPQELNVMYRHILHDIKPDDLSLTWRLLCWLCFAIRPLSTHELRHVMGFNRQLSFTSIEQHQSSEDFSDDIEQSERRLKTLSKGLVEIKVQGQQRIAQFMHQSVDDYMKRSGLELLLQRSPEIVIGIESSEIASRDRIAGLAHFEISRTCLKYLALDELRSDHHQLGEIQKIVSDLPLVEYATAFWTSHAETAELRGILQHDLIDVLSWPSDRLMDTWIGLRRSLEGPESSRLADGTSLAHLCAEFNLESTMRIMLEKCNSQGK